MSEQEQEASNTTNDLSDQIFDRFKSYLDNKVAALTTEITSKTTHQTKQIERHSEGNQLQFPGNKDQYLFNAELQNTLEDTINSLRQPTLEHLEAAQDLIHKRQKKTKQADKSEAGWLAVKEYEADDLASNSDDEKRIRKAQASALRKKARLRRPKSFNGSPYKSDFRNRVPDGRDNQLFRGNKYYSILIPLRAYCVTRLHSRPLSLFIQEVG